MEEFKDASPPEELLDHLKLSDQKSSESGPKDAQNPENVESGYTPSSAKDSTTADEHFHDCHDSLETKEPVLDDEGNVQNETSSRKQTELDEEYLLELEKDMPEEEKQVIQIMYVPTYNSCHFFPFYLSTVLLISCTAGPLEQVIFQRADPAS